MGFTNTQYTDAIQSLVNSSINIMDNPLYLFNDKRATIVDYYNKDVNLSTLDEGSGLEYNTIGENCPSKFNKIIDALLYGIDKIQLNYTMDDDKGGIFNDDIVGEAFILPNTFIPQVGDFFQIKYIKEKMLFIVNEVQQDTLDNGFNFYKINYKLDQVGEDRIEELNEYNVVESFKMLTSTVGTSMKSIIKSSDYDFIKTIEESTKSLKEYYKQLFFKNQIQTFSYMLNGYHIYDPYLIEFLIRNSILSGTDRYVYVDHAMATWETFGIDYDHTFFRALEERDTEKADNCTTIAVAMKVEDKMSLLTTRLDDYYYIDYNINKYAPFTTKIEVIPNTFIDSVVSKDIELDEKIPRFYKIIVDYFDKDHKLEIDDLKLLDSIELNEPKDIFYGIPMLIFVLESYNKEILTTLENK